MPNWKKVIVSGSNATLNSVNVTTNVVAQSFTGSLQGTSSWAVSALTASYADNFTVAGTLTAQTIVVQTITSSTDYVTGSTIFGSQLSNTHQFTGSVSITGSLTVNGVSNLTASNAVTASYALTASNVQGGTQYYVPLWDTNTSLASSYLNQSGSVLKTIYSGLDKGLTLDYNFNSFILGNAGVGNNTYLQVYDGGSTINIYSPNYTYFNDKVGIRIIPTNPGLAVSGSLEVTGPGTSKFMNSNVQIDGNLFMSGSNRLVYNNDATNNMLFGMFDGSTIHGPYYQLFGNNYSNIVQRGSAEFVYDNRNGGDSGFNIASFNGSTWTRKFRVDDNGAQVTGSLIVTNGITGSLYGTASWAENAVNALSAETASNIQGGATNYIPVFKTPTSLSSSVVYQSGSHIGINETNFTSGDPEALYVFQTHPTSFNVITGKGNSNNYLQLNIQNTNTGTTASSDVVATADNGTETSNYIDMGINGSNFSGPIGDPNDAYLYSAGNHLHIGNITPGQPLQFFVGGDDTNLNRKLQLNDNNQHNMTGSLNVSGSVTAFSFTGSLQGTSSWAENAITASHAVNALSASYALNATNAISASYATSASHANNATSASYTLIATSASFASTASYINPLNQLVIITGSLIQGLEGNIATGEYSHAEGSITKATGDYSHAEGDFTQAKGNYSHAEGQETIASGSYSHAEGYQTIALANHQHVQGQFNTVSSVPAAFIVGNGTDDGNRSNLIYAHDSTVEITGSLEVNGGITGSLQGTASWANNATNAINAATASSADNFTVRGTLTAQTIVVQTITSSTEFITGSTKFGTQLTDTHQFTGSVSITGSLFTNGSNTLVGSTTLTGSLNITGSTTQTGNNTLIGNTTLSGSIIISGSQGPGAATASVQIYGDIRQTGYHRFDPVTTNIDTSITASYIYVSGSTNDLYFSQNSAGYSNVTRLRWLEGNLYTGLLHGGLITTQSSTVYQVSSGSGIIVNLNASLSDDPYPTIQYLKWGNLSASIAPLTSSYQQAFVGIDSTNNIYAQGTPFSNGQFDYIINIGNVLFQNQSTINGVKTQPSVAYGFEQQQNIFNRAFGPLKLSGYTLAPSGSSTGSLVVGSGTAYSPGSNYTIDPNEPYYTVDNGTNVSKIFRYYQSGSSWVYLTNAGAGFATIDPTQYSNNGVLTLVPSPVGSRWTIQRVFWFPNSVTKAIVVYYGNTVYTSESEAIANINIEPFVEAPNTAANAIYLGAIVINGDGVFTDVNDFTIVPGGLFRQVGGSGGGGSIITQTLSGLSDVLISGPTDGQALVYDTTAAKWRNLSSISASISGNAATATTASYAVTASYALNAISASYVLNAISASYATTSSYTINAISASYSATATSASYALTSSYSNNSTSASYALNATTASYALVATSASYALAATSASYSLSGSYAVNATTASYATTSSNILGGAQYYAAIWKDGTSLTTGSIFNSGSFVGINKTNPSYSIDSSGVISSDGFLPYLGFSNPVGRTFNYVTSFGSGNTINYPGTGTAGFQYNYFANNEFYTTAGGTSNLLMVGFRNQNYVRSTVSTVPFQMIALNNLLVANDANDLGTLGQLYTVFTSFNREATASPLGGNSIAYHFNTQTRLRSGFYTTTRWGNENLQVADTAGSQASTITDYDFLLNTTNVGSTSGGPGTITNFYLLRHVTNIGATGTITNRWGLYLTDSSFKSYHAGNFLLGTTDNPGYKLNVSGSGNFTNNLTATGSITFPSLSNINQNNVVGYDTTTGQLYYQSTSSLSVTSASYAATASHANNGFTIGITQTYTNTVASSVVGSNNVFTQTTGSYTSAFYKYTVSNGANARSGEVIAVWNGSSAQYTDYSTLDIGSTSGVIPSVSVVGSDVLFNITTGTSGWRLKSTVTYL